MPGVRTWWIVSAVIAILAVSVVPVPAAARSFAWSLTCDGGGSVGMSWNWTQGGVPIPAAGGTPGCGTSGGETRPASADGFTGHLSIVLCGDIFPCAVDTDSVTKSFNPAHAFKTTLSVSASVQVSICDPSNFCKHNRFITVSGSAKFTISS